MNIMYHNYLRIFINDALSYDGEILIYEDNSCEGIIINKNNDKNYVYGTFKKNENLNLIIENEDESKVIFNAKKTYLKYEGECKIIKDSTLTEIPFYLKVTSLDIDPRDCWLEDDPKFIFLSKLNNFKEKIEHLKKK